MCAPGIELRSLSSWEKQAFGYRKEKDSKRGVPQLRQGKSLEAQTVLGTLVYAP